MKKYTQCNPSLSGRLCAAGYPLQEKDLPRAARVMAAAFSDDASIRYLLGGTQEGSNDWKYFLCVLRAVFGRCVMLSADENINDLLILFPPELKAVPALPFLLRGGVMLCRSFGPALFLRSLNYENNCKTVKRRHIGESTWYCMCFAVTPHLQGQGRGSRLIRPALEVLDSSHIPLYLETHKQVNVSIYEHLGFETVEKNTIPGTPIPQHAMVRSAGNPSPAICDDRSM